MSFRSIFSPLKGNLFQRLVKFWIFPWAPKLEIFIYYLLGVGIFRRVVMRTVGRIRGWNGEQDNYHIGERTLNNLLTFATNMTMINEVLHPFYFVFVWIFLGGFNLSVLSVLISLAAVTNFYCILLQRFNRAKLVLMIEDRMNEGEMPDNRYKNWLALDFGKAQKTRS